MPVLRGTQLLHSQCGRLHTCVGGEAKAIDPVALPEALIALFLEDTCHHLVEGEVTARERRRGHEQRHEDEDPPWSYCLPQYPPIGHESQGEIKGREEGGASVFMIMRVRSRGATTVLRRAPATPPTTARRQSFGFFGPLSDITSRTLS
jgi:hypothetical protein